MKMRGRRINEETEREKQRKGTQRLTDSQRIRFANSLAFPLFFSFRLFNFRLHRQLCPNLFIIFIFSAIFDVRKSPSSLIFLPFLPLYTCDLWCLQTNGTAPQYLSSNLGTVNSRFSEPLRGDRKGFIIGKVHYMVIVFL